MQTPMLTYRGGARRLGYSLSLYIQSYFVYESSEGCGEPVYLSGSHEYSFLDNAISAKISCAGSYVVNTGLDQYDDVHDIVNVVLITF